jgi:hypothetical protein
MRGWRFGTILLVLTLIALSAHLSVGPAAAQDNPRAEVYLGYAALAGFNGSVAVNMNRWFGVAGDYSYRVAEYYADKPLQTFTAGPRLTLRLLPQLTPYAHALLGGAGSSCARFSDSSGCRFGTAFAMVLGGGLDIHIGRDIAIRAIQIDKIYTRFGNHTDSYPGISFGIVARLGQMRH